MKISGFVAIFLLWTIGAAAQTDFYSGKQVRIVVGGSSGAITDQYARVIASRLPRHIQGKPEMIVQNMPGGGSIIAANYVYGVAKPDGLTLGMVNSAIYFSQLRGRQEVQFDWSKFSWIGSAEPSDELLFVLSATPFKTLLDIRNAKEPVRCGATGVGTTGYYFPKLLEQTLGTRFHVVTGYQGGPEVDLALERKEVQCRAATINSVFGREPTRSWVKNGFIRVLVQSGAKRDSLLPDTPTIWELMEKEKVPDSSRRLATVVLSPGAFGRPLLATPAIPADALRVLREAYSKMLQDPEYVSEARKRQWDINPVSPERLTALAKEVIDQPPEIVERVKTILGE